MPSTWAKLDLRGTAIHCRQRYSCCASFNLHYGASSSIIRRTKSANWRRTRIPSCMKSFWRCLIKKEEVPFKWRGKRWVVFPARELPEKSTFEMNLFTTSRKNSPWSSRLSRIPSRLMVLTLDKNWRNTMTRSLRRGQDYTIPEKSEIDWLWRTCIQELWSNSKWTLYTVFHKMKLCFLQNKLKSKFVYFKNKFPH